MAEIIRKAIRGYKFLFIDMVDQRSKDWFLTGKPYQGLLLLGIYLSFVFKWGPRWMKDRPAYKMNVVLMAYNLLQVIACGNLFIHSLKFWGWGGTYKWICQPVDYSTSENGITEMTLAYQYLLLKVLDLFDTVFFVLRKKFNQVSFLHIYHHTGMVLLIWAAITYFPGGHGTLIGVVNSFVHCFMYTYYLLSVAWPSVKKLIWAKKFVTQLQIIQFFIFVVHIGIITFVSDCQYPTWVAAVFLPQNIFMLVLFIDFYIRTYVTRSKNEKAEVEVTSIDNDNVHENMSYKKTDENGKIQIDNEGHFIRNQNHLLGLRERAVNRT